ncbi:MAG: alanine--tRNA ligase [Phycisphaerales bacterium]|nr:alanine--tRNA ligase [Phycisphaerales bacterium]
MPPTAPEIRQRFLDFFVKQAEHTQVPSGPVVPHDDPTLLFTNAGMNQFKDVFLGQGTRPYSRAVDTQKCIRAGGKHNDLEDVGRDTYHHTFFEMVGNWSFGDYFKAEAIEWAWNLLTEVFGIDGDRLYATYFQGNPDQGLEPDLEARDFWLRHLPPERVLPFGMKDNFWEMGETGPCGPCSELHYDRIGGRNAADLVNMDDPDVLEIWNLVFIQFNRETDGSLKPLPAKHVDTGMGFERLVSILQDVRSNYDTDLFSGIFERIRDVTNARPYRGQLEDPVDIAYRIIADHVRCLSAALADGATPGADGRGYVLRRILRRAVRHGRQTLGAERPFLASVVPAVVDSLGDVFPEIREKAGRIEEIIQQEEETFRRTLDRGLALFANTAETVEADGSRTVPAIDAFKLHDTYGFPIDLTQVMAEERGLALDLEGYEALMEEARQKSRGVGGDADPVFTMPPDVLGKLDFLRVRATDDSPKYVGKPITAVVKAIWNGRKLEEHAETTQRIGVILDRTPFYGEQGGQIGDVGELHLNRESSAGHDHACTVEVEDTRRVGDYVLHVGRISHGRLVVGDDVEAIVEVHRRDGIRRNHTTTHLLNLALRDVAGPDSDQRGSLVAADRLRFDYAGSGALTPDQLADIEQQVQARIDDDLAVHTELVELEQAQSIKTLRAVFGERYPDPVRVVSVGAPIPELLANPEDERWSDVSVEFCGGTHLDRTSEADGFALLSEQGLAAGVRRVTAVTGPEAAEARSLAKRFEEQIAQAEHGDGTEAARILDEVVQTFETAAISATDRHQLQGRLEGLRAKAKTARKAQQAESRGEVVEQAKAIADTATGRVVVAQLDGADKDGLLSAMDAIRTRHEDAAVLLLSADHDNGKVTIVAKVPQDLVAEGLKAGDWVKAAAQACGGGGGGRPDSAQAGGKDPSKAGEAREAAQSFADEKLGVS